MIGRSPSRQQKDIEQENNQENDQLIIANAKVPMDFHGGHR